MHRVRQFAIVYAYWPPNLAYPTGLVSVRHVRNEHIFKGVREARLPWVYECDVALEGL